MIAKSADLTIWGAEKNLEGNYSPKNTISGFTSALHYSHCKASSLAANYFHFAMLDSFLQPIQCAERECPWAWISLSSGIPALISRSSMFWVKFI